MQAVLDACTNALPGIVLYAGIGRATRSARTGVSIGPEQAVCVYDALKGVTVNAAYAYGEEDSKGTLEAGKLADLVVLEADPLSVEPMAIKDIAVAATYKEGECLYGGL